MRFRFRDLFRGGKINNRDNLGNGDRDLLPPSPGGNYFIVDAGIVETLGRTNQLSVLQYFPQLVVPSSVKDEVLERRDNARAVRFMEKIPPWTIEARVRSDVVEAHLSALPDGARRAEAEIIALTEEIARQGGIPRPLVSDLSIVDPEKPGGPKAVCQPKDLHQMFVFVAEVESNKKLLLSEALDGIVHPDMEIESFQRDLKNLEDGKSHGFWRGSEFDAKSVERTLEEAKAHDHEQAQDQGQEHEH
jgi:hypothetical protein